jgi:pimeloyl-ACP methyl ester carboxylesterase
LPHLAGVTHRTVEIPGVRLHVAEAGSGEPVLLLHGFPQHWWEWRDIILPLAENYRVICPDLRGAGWSDAPRGGYTHDQLLADVIALMDELELDRVHLVGHDWGAIVGFDLAIFHPERVHDYLALAVPHPFIRFHWSLIPLFRYLWFQPIVASPGLGPAVLGSGRQRMARYLLKGFTVHAHSFRDEDMEAFLAPLRDRAHARAGSALYRRFILPTVVRIFSGQYKHTYLSPPTRIVYGLDDKAIRPELLGGHENHAADVEVEFVEGAGHFIADDRPDIVVDRARSLFARR